MSIIKCPECGKDISDKAAACIYCGYPINKVAESELPESSAPNNEEQAPNQKAGRSSGRRGFDYRDCRYVWKPA